MTIRNQVLSALRWATMAKFAGQVVSWAITLVVIRLLTPADYGLMAVAMIFIGLLTLIGELGLGAALVQKQETDREVLRRIFAMLILIYGMLSLVLYLSAPFIAAFFDMEQLVLVLRVLALVFLLMIFEVIPQSNLTRELAFKHKSIVDLLATMAGSVCTLVLALLDFAVWSLVLGYIVLALVRVVGINLIAPVWLWPSFSFRGLSRFFFFGGGVTMERMLWFCYVQADTFIIGKMLGKEMVGFYSVAIHLASLPMQKVNGVINLVAFPAFARVQNNDAEVAYYLEKAFRVLGAVAFPVFFGISAVAPELVLVFLGEKWQTTIVPMQLLSLIMPLRALSNLIPAVVNARGRPGRNVSNLSIALVLMASAFFAGAFWGLLGVSLAWVLVYPLVFSIEVWRAAPVCATRFSILLKAVVKPAVFATIMYGLIAWLRIPLEGTLSASYNFSIYVLVGAITYAGLSWSFNRRGMMEIKDLLRR